VPHATQRPKSTLVQSLEEGLMFAGATLRYQMVIRYDNHHPRSGFDGG
jgi:hypothetical protein